MVKSCNVLRATLVPISKRSAIFRVNFSIWLSLYKSIECLKTLCAFVFWLDSVIRKFTNFKKDLFDDYSNQKNHKKNIAWFQENFERSSSAEKIFQDKFKQIQEYYKRETKGNKAEYNKEIQNWLNRNDVTHSNGDNQAWYNPYIQHWLTPKNPDEYYTDEYRNLLIYMKLKN